MIIKPGDVSVKENYKLISSSILPRPIALVSTLSESGIPNLAPFSFFTGITSRPPTICFAPARKGSSGKKKDTLANIEQSDEFVINVVTEEIAEQMIETATDFPPEVNEFELAGLTAIESKLVKPPCVKESPINMECRLYKSIHIGDGSTGSGALVIGEIILYHIDDSLYKDGRIDTGLLRPVGRLAGQEYTTLGKRFILNQKSFKK